MMVRARANTARKRVTVALARVMKREREVPEWVTMMMGDGSRQKVNSVVIRV